MTTEARIRALLVKDYQLDPDRLTPDALIEDLGIDSIGRAELIFNIEDEFKLEVPDQAVQLLTLGDVVQFIEKLVADQGAEAGNSTAATEHPHPVT